MVTLYNECFTHQNRCQLPDFCIAHLRTVFMESLYPIHVWLNAQRLVRNCSVQFSSPWCFFWYAKMPKYYAHLPDGLSRGFQGIQDGGVHLLRLAFMQVGLTRVGCKCLCCSDLFNIYVTGQFCTNLKNDCTLLSDSVYLMCNLNCKSVWFVKIFSFFPYLNADSWIYQRSTWEMASYHLQNQLKMMAIWPD